MITYVNKVLELIQKLKTSKIGFAVRMLFGTTRYTSKIELLVRMLLWTSCVNVNALFTQWGIGKSKRKKYKQWTW